VIQDLPDYVWDVDWVLTSDAYLLVNGCQDGSVWMWELIDSDKDQLEVRLRWSSMTNVLAMTGAIVHGVQGLSYPHKQLLDQRGVVGEPVHRLREAVKKVASLTSVVSRFKSFSGGMVESWTA
jgi:hypothetical protein